MLHGDRKEGPLWGGLCRRRRCRSLEKVGKQTLSPSLPDAHAARGPRTAVPESGWAWAWGVPAGARVGGSRGAPIPLGSELGWAAQPSQAQARGQSAGPPPGGAQTFLCPWTHADRHTHATSTVHTQAHVHMSTCTSHMGPCTHVLSMHAHACTHRHTHTCAGPQETGCIKKSALHFLP